MNNFSAQFKGRGKRSKIVRREPITREGFMKEGCSPRRLCLGREGWGLSGKRIEKKFKETEKRG